MNKTRPVYLGTDAFLGLPITAMTSITHRVTGVILFGAIPILLWMLAKSLESAASFAELQSQLSTFIGSFVLWAIVASFTFHVVAGFRHLLMDLGIGESLQGGKTGSVIVLVVSAVLILAEGVWICLPM